MTLWYCNRADLLLTKTEKSGTMHAQKGMVPRQEAWLHLATGPHVPGMLHICLVRSS